MLAYRQAMPQGLVSVL